ncbi:MAG: biotin-dependent carboxyltransferase family protein [Actinobacteria bacterium]|nr:biotin-dependent carboxyltransferase family protein [Actinomycetota bacterium]
MSALDVVAWGIAGSVRDAGRPGRAWLGASRGGAVDLASLGLANRLVGNPPDAAAFESSGGLHIRVGARPVMVAVAGGVADVAGDAAVGWGVPDVLPPGAELRFGRVHEGTRVYLSVRGGLIATSEPGRFEVGADPTTPAASHHAVRRPGPDRLLVWSGPRVDWFQPDSLAALTGSPWTVTTHSDRVGVRLSGPALRRLVTHELPSEGMVEGAVQVPPDGQPIVMLADHPVTGGYPVIAVVDPADLGHLLQSPPGSTLRFRLADPDSRLTSG